MQKHASCCFNWWMNEWLHWTVQVHGSVLCEFQFEINKSKKPHSFQFTQIKCLRSHLPFRMNTFFLSPAHRTTAIFRYSQHKYSNWEACKDRLTLIFPNKYYFGSRYFFCSLDVRCPTNVSFVLPLQRFFFVYSLLFLIFTQEIRVSFRFVWIAPN